MECRVVDKKRWVLYANLYIPKVAKDVSFEETSSGSLEKTCLIGMWGIPSDSRYVNFPLVYPLRNPSHHTPSPSKSWTRTYNKRSMKIY